jgi:hypothetical protein
MPEPVAKPSPPELRPSHRRARRKRGRPVVGKGSRRVSITVEQALLGQTDAYARKHKISRSQAIAAGLRALLAKAS